MKVPFKGCEHVTAKDVSLSCPKCEATPLRARGRGAAVTDHDTITKTAYCHDCTTPLGTIRVKMNTLFGIEEDNRVLNGRFRVY